MQQKLDDDIERVQSQTSRRVQFQTYRVHFHSGAWTPYSHRSLRLNKNATFTWNNTYHSNPAGDYGEEHTIEIKGTWYRQGTQIELIVDDDADLRRLPGTSLTKVGPRGIKWTDFMHDDPNPGSQRLGSANFMTMEQC